MAQRWGQRVYKRVTERRAHLKRCGKKCYLDPNPKRPRYPVCPKGSCVVSCQGLQAAMRRAITQRKRALARKAERMGLRRCARGFGKKLGRG